MVENITVHPGSFLGIAAVAAGLSAWYYWQGLDIAGSGALMTAAIGLTIWHILFYLNVSRDTEAGETHS